MSERYYLIELYNVWMTNNLKDMNLSRDSLNIRLILDFVFLQNFYCNFFSC